MRLTAIIAAAGDSQRMGSAVSKALLPLAGKPVLAHVLEMWQGLATEMVVATRPDDWQAVSALVTPYGKAVHLTVGGKNRATSVMLALEALKDNDLPELIAVHDAARPLSAKCDIERVLEKAEHMGAAILVAPLIDTIRWQAEGFCGTLLPREQLLSVQTPQIFWAERLISAYAQADEAAFAAATDDAALVIAAGYPCAYIWAKAANLKLTRPEDLAMAEAIIMNRV